MGQQQIFIAFIVVIIVGIAIIAGIGLFEKEELIFLEDEYTQFMMEVGEEAQAWYVKPEQLGGGGNSFKNIDFNHVGCPYGTVNQGQPKLCESRDGKLVTSVSIENLFPGYAIIRSNIFVDQDKYRAEMHVYPDSIVWAQEWEQYN